MASRRFFHPEDGRRLGLEGMIEMIVRGCDFDLLEKQKEFKTKKNIFSGDTVPSVELGVALTAIENGHKDVSLAQFGLESFKSKRKSANGFGYHWTGGAGKSSLIDELVQRFLNAYPTKKIAVGVWIRQNAKPAAPFLGIVFV